MLGPRRDLASEPIIAVFLFSAVAAFYYSARAVIHHVGGWKKEGQERMFPYLAIVGFAGAAFLSTLGATGQSWIATGCQFYLWLLHLRHHRTSGSHGRNRYRRDFGRLPRKFAHRRIYRRPDQWSHRPAPPRRRRLVVGCYLRCG